MQFQYNKAGCPMMPQHAEEVQHNRSSLHKPSGFQAVISFSLTSWQEALRETISTPKAFCFLQKSQLLPILFTCSTFLGEEGTDEDVPVQGWLQQVMGSWKHSRWRRRPWHWNSCLLSVYYSLSLKNLLEMPWQRKAPGECRMRLPQREKNIKPHLIFKPDFADSPQL